MLERSEVRVRPDPFPNEEVISLLKDALEQAPPDKGLLIFIDLNLSSQANEEKFIDQANTALRKAIKPSSDENPHPFSLITFTKG